MAKIFLGRSGKIFSFNIVAKNWLGGKDFRR